MEMQSSGNRNVEGWWGVLALKMDKFQSLEVSKFQRFEFPIFNFQTCQSFKVSKIQNPSHASYKYGYHIQCQLFISFLIDVDPIFQRFSENIRRVFVISWPPSFPKMSRDLLLISFENPGVSKDKQYWFWESRTRPPSPKAIKMMGFRVFPK